jgi:hypothetical protein
MDVQVWANSATMNEKFLRHIERIALATFGQGLGGIRSIGVRFGDMTGPGSALSFDCEAAVVLGDGTELSAYARDIDAAVCFYQAAHALYQTLEGAPAETVVDNLPLAAELRRPASDLAEPPGERPERA